mmetsp:Transcript_14320/g.56358  ORF Transcript_14320/g.56358 Transcript_14320/m.56358 type:complete len:358 (+) Transcript_14320:63-1136(+)
MPLNEEKLGAVKSSLLQVYSGSVALVNLGIGIQLGLFDALAAGGGLTASELAKKTSTNQRYIEDWLVNQTLNDFVTREGADGPAGTGTYSLSEEQKVCIATDGGPHDMAGGALSVMGVANQVESIIDNFRTGGGLAWPDQHKFVHSGARRFFAPIYRHLLAQHIIPSLDGVEEKLKAGVRVVDVGCGQGESTMAMGAAYPKSTIVGVDYHAGSIEVAKEKNSLPNVSFTSENATTVTNEDGKFDLVCVFDCFHDMSDPVGAAKNFKNLLNDSGSVFLIEPMAGETIGANDNIVGRIYSGFSSTCCLQCAKAGDGGAELGTIAPSSRIEAVFKEAGYAKFNPVSVPQAAFNRVFQVQV